jgi:hypothetical protein
LTEKKKVIIRKPSIVRKTEDEKDVRVVFFTKETLRDDFRLAVETNGETMKDVLTDYMDYYIKQLRKKDPNFDEKLREREN